MIEPRQPLSPAEAVRALVYGRAERESQEPEHRPWPDSRLDPTLATVDEMADQLAVVVREPLDSAMTQ